MSYTEHPKFNPEWENCERVYLDRTSKEIEWVYVNPDAEDAPQFVSMVCNFEDFCESLHDALKGCGDFMDYFDSRHREYLADRHTEFFEEMCDMFAHNVPDYISDPDEDIVWAALNIYAKIRNATFEIIEVPT